MRLVSFAIIVLAYLLAGCSDEAQVGPAGPSSNPCPTGHVVGPDGACMPVGIQGCAELFIEDDGLCHPSMDKCPAGTIPQFVAGTPRTPGLDEGCVPVGIQGCAELFIEEDGLCHPSMDKCPEGTFAVPTEGCVPVDGPDGCGSGTWGNIPGGPNTVWVDPGYQGGDGDGSKAKPFTTIAAAISAEPKGGRVALAAGSYGEPVVIEKPLELVGRCPSMVTIGGTTTDFDPPVIVAVKNTSGVSVRGLRIGGAGIGVAVLDAKATLQRVVVQKSTSAGVLVQGAGATVTVEQSLVADTLPRESDSGGGRGIEVYQGASATVVASAVVGNHAGGLHASGVGTIVTVEQSLVADTLPQESDSSFGRGINVQKGASATVVASASVRNHEAGLYASGAGTTVTVEQSLVADTLPRVSDSEFGRGIGVQEGAIATVVASTVIRNRREGLYASGAGTTITVEQSLVADTLPQASDSRFGRGIGVYLGAHASVLASAVIRNNETGLAAMYPDTTVTVEQSLVEETLPKGDGSYGVGLACAGVAANLSVGSSLVRASHTAGIMATNGCTATLVASLVDGVLPGKFHRYTNNQIAATYDGISDGVVVAFGSTATVSNTRVTGCARAGMVFESSSGLLSGVSTEGARYGLVAQGEPKPDWSDPTNVFGATELSILTDGDLPVPGPPPIPEE